MKRAPQDNPIVNIGIGLLIAIISIVVFFFTHPAQRFSFIPVMIAAFICYVRTIAQEMPDAERFLPYYLLALAVQLIHFAEEYTFGFQVRIVDVLPAMPPFDQTTFVVFNMVAYAIFLLGGIGVFYKVRSSMLIVWFFSIVFLANSVWHLLLAVWVGGYFPGLYTSIPGWLFGPLLLNRIGSRR